ncbi:MAG TPA: hypothetical protein VIX83_08660 [Candidatus Cybelea sp.]
MQPANTTTIASCYVAANGTQAFGYVGSDQRLYQFIEEGNPGSPWQTIDLIAQWQSEANLTLPFPRAGAGPRGDGPIAMNTFEAIAGFFLCYIDQNDHIQALPYPLDDSTYSPPGWLPGGTLGAALFPDITQRTGAPPAASGSSIACYAWESQQSQHIVYVGADGNVWELYWIAGQYDNARGGPLWKSNNLSADTGYTGVLAPNLKNVSLAATMFERENSEHVIYIAGDNTIRELYFYDGRWGGNNLSEATGAAPPAANAPLATFACTYEDTLHVVYLGDDDKVHELWWGNGGWQPDHTISTSGPAVNTALVGYACENEQSHHVIYIDVNNDIQELYHNSGGWSNTTLSFSAGSGATPPLSTASPLSGNSAAYYDDGQAAHVFYLDNETRVHELYRFNNQWIAGETSG